MTGAMYAITKWGLSLLPVDDAGRRVFDETLADWRNERARASSPAAAVLVSVRAIGSVFRGVTMVSLREIRARDGALLLLRLAAVSIVCMLLSIGLRWNDSVDVRGMPVRTGPVPGVLLSVQVLTVMPFLAFLCAAIGGRRSVPGPRLGPALLAAGVMFVAMGWVLPAANQSYREFMFALQSSGAAPRPGVNERSIVELAGMLFTPESVSAAFGISIRLLFLVAVPVMLVIGTTVRTLTGWRRVAGTVLPLLVFVVPALIGVNRPGVIAWWPALLAAVLIARALVRSGNHESLSGAGAAS